MRLKQHIGFLYINGLGDGAATFKDKVVAWWWQRAGVSIRHVHIDWYDGKSLEEKMLLVEQTAKEMLGEFYGIVLIGSSAGGSLAINSFYKMRDKNICVVSAHGRLSAGNYPKNHRMSLYRKAHLNTARPSQSFYDSVKMAETQVIPKLSQQDKERLLVLTQLADLVVPLKTMGILGVRSHHSFAFGHSGGFVAHLLADRNLIIRFALRALS